MSIVITGNPGVGKHTITKKISQKLNFPIIDINTLAKESEVIEKQENTNDVDTKKLANIVVSHVSPSQRDATANFSIKGWIGK